MSALAVVDEKATTMAKAFTEEWVNVFGTPRH